MFLQLLNDTFAVGNQIQNCHSPYSTRHNFISEFSKSHPSNTSGCLIASPQEHVMHMHKEQVTIEQTVDVWSIIKTRTVILHVGAYNL